MFGNGKAYVSVGRGVSAPAQGSDLIPGVDSAAASSASAPGIVDASMPAFGATPSGAAPGGTTTPGTGTPAPAPSPSTVIAYQLRTIAAEFPRARVLVMAVGRLARKVVQDAYDLGLSPCVPATKDRKLDTPTKFVEQRCILGAKASPALLRNAYAVREAARACNAQFVFLAEDSLALARDGAFVALLAREGVSVFCPVAGMPAGSAWQLCEPDGSALAQFDAADGAEPRWRSCPHCGLSFAEAVVRRLHFTCPECAGYLRMGARDRFEALLDRASFEELFANVPDADPLSFPGYAEKLAAQRAKTGLGETVVTAVGSILGLRTALAVMDPHFFMGSMGHVVGEKLSRLFDFATEEGLPVIVLCASGGARMQEGLSSLMQMAKVSCAVERHSREGLLFVSVLTDPTTGGVTASFAMQGDIILAEPHALIGFAGQRVIKDTIKQELPEGFQTAEFALEHGLIDAIVERPRLRTALGHLLALHGAPAASPDASPDAFLPGSAAYARISKLVAASAPSEGAGLSGAQAGSQAFGQGGARQRDVVSSFAAKIASAADRLGLRQKAGLPPSSLDACAGACEYAEAAPATPVASHAAAIEGASGAWESVQLARNVRRPTSVAYIRGLVDGFFELHGDRAFADDAAIMAGIGWIEGRPVTVIAQEKGENLNERIRRNFGCPQPEGYRKSLRLMRQAQKFGRPIVCLVDTQGAFCGTEAEERGQGNAIADNLVEMAGLRVPVVSVLLGEGGSGGALALAVANRVGMQQHAVYSVLSPEGFASILWKDRARAPEAAALMRMGAEDVCRMGYVDAVISEGAGPAHENPEEAIAEVRSYVIESLAALDGLDSAALIAQRQARFARF